MPKGNEGTAAYVSQVFDDAFALSEEYTGIIERRRANRQQLRLLDAQGYLSADERRTMFEIYPKREKKTSDEPEAVAA